MSIARALWILSGVMWCAGAAACGDRPRPTPVTPPAGPDAGAPPPIDPGDAGSAGAIVVPPADPGVRIAPHAAQIMATAIDRSGTAAITLDLIGDVRLWRSLDGKQPPIAMPFHGARGLELAVDASGLVVGRIDPSGAAHFYRFDRDGHLTATGSAAAVPPTIGLVAMTTEAWLLVRADHSIALVDARGDALHELAHTGVRIEALRPLGADAAVAMISRNTDGDAAFAVVRVGVVAGKISWGREAALAIAPVQPVELAAAPDGVRLAYFADPAVVKAAATGAPHPTAPREASARAPSGPGARRRPPPQQPEANRVAVVVELATGAVVTPTDLVDAQVNAAQRLGFSSAETLHVYGANSGDLTAGLGADAVVVPGTLPRTSAPAVGPGVIVCGYDRNLLVQRVGGETRYLGYQLGTPQMAALSPDGSRVAWATGDGQILIETLDGSAPDVGIEEVTGGLVALEFADAGRVLAVSQRGELKLFDATRGAELAGVTAPGASYSVQYHRRTGWVVGLRDGGGVWALRLEPAAATPWSTPKVIADGSVGFWLLDAATAEAPALMTVDSNAVARRYTGAQLATGVAVGKVGKIAQQRLPQLPSYVDQVGRPYVFDGTAIRAGDGDGSVNGIFATLTAPRDLVRSPDGGVLIAFDQERTAFALEPDGAVRWTLGVGSAGWRPAFSLDGRRVALISGSGGQIVDVATGAVVTARCGWAFGAYPTVPSGFSSQVHPICE